MSLSIDMIPCKDVAPAGARRSRVRRSLVQYGFGRRAFLKATVVMLSAGALATFEGLVLRRPARALPDTHNHCNDYVGSSWDNGYWTECNPHADDNVDDLPHATHIPIGSGYCDSDGYHRTDAERIGYDDNGDPIFRNYGRRAGSCKNKNAWVWKIRHDFGTPNKRNRRCSDGKFRIETQGSPNPSWRFSVCQDLLPLNDPEQAVQITDDHA